MCGPLRAALRLFPVLQSGTGEANNTVWFEKLLPPNGVVAVLVSDFRLVSRTVTLFVVPAPHRSCGADWLFSYTGLVYRLVRALRPQLRLVLR